MIMIYPLIWMIGSSLKPADLIFSNPGLIPSEVTLQNYVRGWNAFGVPFSRFFINSFLLCFGVVLGNLISCTMTAFAFARLHFRLMSIAFALMMISIMLPQQVALIPQFIVFQRIGWTDSFKPLVVPSFFATQGFFVFLILQFMRGIPIELDEAAYADGANKFWIFWKIILPLSTPALVTTAIFSFVWTWNNFLGQLIYLSNIRRFTMPLALRAFLDATGRSSFGPLFAMSVLSLIPAFLFFVFAQRFLVQGISTTGVKG
jgi:multiple sugar transport system permease protein